MFLIETAGSEPDESEVSLTAVNLSTFRQIESFQSLIGQKDLRTQTTEKNDDSTVRFHLSFKDIFIRHNRYQSHFPLYWYFNIYLLVAT
ncbi:hypothetical protein ACQV18_04950 [Facklamia sp. P9177]